MISESSKALGKLIYTIRSHVKDLMFPSKDSAENMDTPVDSAVLALLLHGSIIVLKRNLLAAVSVRGKKGQARIYREAASFAGTVGWAAGSLQVTAHFCARWMYRT
jgi:hypothetical protein